MSRSRARPLAVAGHPRSGTTLLTRLLNTHPEVTVCFEFQCFDRLGEGHASHMATLRRDWRRRRLVESRPPRPQLDRWRSALFLARYAWAMGRHRAGAIGAVQVADALGACFPRARVVGDKFPAYVFALDELAAQPELALIVIYRDCRDVVRSTLREVAGAWRGRSFAARLDSPEKVAQNWVRAMETTRRHAGRALLIRYEELVTRPDAVMAAVAEHIDVAAAGFDTGVVRPDRVGAHHGALSAEALQAIDAVAGPTLARLGYGSAPASPTDRGVAQL